MFGNALPSFNDDGPPLKKLKLDDFGAPDASTSADAGDDIYHMNHPDNPYLKPLKNLETTTAQGSGSSVYTIERKNGYYQCSCPAFKFSNKANAGKPWSCRTCKHLAAFRGAAAETERIAAYETGKIHGVSQPKTAAAKAEAKSPAKAGAKSPAKATSSAAKAKSRAKADGVNGASSSVAGHGSNQTAGSGVPAAASSTAGKADKAEVSLLLAKTYDGIQDVDGWWVSEKLDGVRAFWDGKRFLSRAGNEFVAPDFFKKDLPTSEHLDGELFLGRGKFQQCVSFVRKDQPLHSEWNQLKYYVFDVIDDKRPFEERMDEGKKLLANKSFAVWHKHDKIQVPKASSPKRSSSPKKGSSDTKDSKDAGVVNLALQSHLDKLLKEIESKGGEGLMLRQPASKYDRTRSSTLLKLKSFHDLDAIVTTIETGKGANKDRMGALHCQDKDGNEFKVGTGFTHKQREDPPKVGQIITIKYMEKTNDNKPRFPVFLRVRNDIKKLQ